MVACQVRDYELLDLPGKSQAQIFDSTVSVPLVAGWDEKHGVWQHYLQMVSEGSHVLGTSLEAMNEYEKMVLSFVCCTLLQGLLRLVFRHGSSSRLWQIIREKVATFVSIDAIKAPLFILGSSFALLFNCLGEDGGVWSFVVSNHDLVMGSELGIASHLSWLAHWNEAVSIGRLSASLDYAGTVKYQLGCNHVLGRAGRYLDKNDTNWLVLTKGW